MNKKAVQWLYQELPDLVNKGVLSPSVADGLYTYYEGVKSTDKKWFVIILCGVLGALLVGLGIILLIGHNWEYLTRPIRMGLSLFPLMIGQGIAFWVLLKRPQSHALKESTATFLSLMVGAAMALISQTYNIPNDTADFFLSWMLLIAPLSYLMTATIPAVIYVAGVTSWAGCYWDSPTQAVFFWILWSAVVPHFIWIIHQEKFKNRATILALAMALSSCFGVGLSLGRNWPGSWIIIYSSLVTLFYFLGTREFRGVSANWQRPFGIIGGVCGFGMMFLLTFRFPWESITEKYHYLRKDISFWNVLPDYALTSLLVGAVLLLFLDCVKRKDWRRVLFGSLPLLAFVGYILGSISVALSIFLFNVFLLIVSMARIILGIRANNLGVINTGMFMLAALILARF